MEKLKKTSLVLILISFLTLLPSTTTALVFGDLARPVGSVLCALYVAFVAIIPPLAILIFAVAGAIWIYSQDDAGKRNAAKVWIVHVIIGAIIAALAWTLATQIGTPTVGPGWFTC